MVIFYRVLVGLLFICVYSAHANASVEFHHADWHITCDNTLTCYAVGYAINNDSDAPLSAKQICSLFVTQVKNSLSMG